MSGSTTKQPGRFNGGRRHWAMNAHYEASGLWTWIHKRQCTIYVYSIHTIYIYKEKIYYTLCIYITNMLQSLSIQHVWASLLLIISPKPTVSTLERLSLQSGFKGYIPELEQFMANWTGKWWWTGFDQPKHCAFTYEFGFVKKNNGLKQSNFGVCNFQRILRIITCLHTFRRGPLLAFHY